MGRAGTRTIAAVFDPRANSLNLLRLVLAALVLIGHAIYLGGFGEVNVADRTSLGTLAVYGFFAISGFLIADSALRRTTSQYLRARFLRIFPAFWVVLVVTAFVICPVASVVAGRGQDWGAYLGEPHGPVGYVWRNVTLWVFQKGIAGEPSGVPVPGIWNGSLWTLSFEFAAYLLILALARAGLLRRPRPLAVIVAGTWLVGLGCTATPVSGWLNQLQAPVLYGVVTLTPIFLTGALLRVARSIPDSGLLAVLCTAGFAVAAVLPIGRVQPAFALTSLTLAAPLLVYPVIWAGVHLPFTRFGRRNDYSYGTYLYAFPVQQALAMAGFTALGVLGFTLLTAVVTGGFALASWHLVERPALRRKQSSIRLREAGAGRQPAPGAVAGAAAAADPQSDRAQST